MATWNGCSCFASTLFTHWFAQRFLHYLICFAYQIALHRFETVSRFDPYVLLIILILHSAFCILNCFFNGDLERVRTVDLQRDRLAF